MIGIKNEGVELWRGWSSTNRDNHLWTWNSMLLGNTMRAAGFIIDRIFSSGKQRSRMEEHVINMKFGIKGHTFQYLWIHGHVLGGSGRPSGKPWPQQGHVAIELPLFFSEK